MALALDQSQASGDEPRNDTIKSRALIGGEAHRNANSFYKAITFRQFLLHFNSHWTSAVYRAQMTNVMSGNFSQFENAMEFKHREKHDEFDDHKSRNSTQDMADPLLNGKSVSLGSPVLMLC